MATANVPPTHALRSWPATVRHTDTGSGLMEQPHTHSLLERGSVCLANYSHPCMALLGSDTLDAGSSRPLLMGANGFSSGVMLACVARCCWRRYTHCAGPFWSSSILPSFWEPSYYCVSIHQSLTWQQHFLSARLSPWAFMLNACIFVFNSES